MKPLVGMLSAGDLRSDTEAGSRACLPTSQPRRWSCCFVLRGTVGVLNEMKTPSTTNRSAPPHSRTNILSDAESDL